MRRPVLAFYLAIILGIIMIAALVRCGGYGPPSDGGKLKGQLALPSPTLQQPLGEPAITPISHNIPAFTKGDVITYITTHDMPFTDTPGSEITVGDKDIIFITSGEVNKIINRQNTGIPNKYLLCFATLTGTFTFPAPPMNGKKPTSVTYTQAYEVFDATTGNLLMGGALGQPTGTIG